MSTILIAVRKCICGEFPCSTINGLFGGLCQQKETSFPIWSTSRHCIMKCAVTLICFSQHAPTIRRLFRLLVGFAKIDLFAVQPEHKRKSLSIQLIYVPRTSWFLYFIIHRVQIILVVAYQLVDRIDDGYWPEKGGAYSEALQRALGIAVCPLSLEVLFDASTAIDDSILGQTSVSWQQSTYRYMSFSTPRSKHKGNKSVGSFNCSNKNVAQ